MSYKDKNRNIDDLTPQMATKYRLFVSLCAKAWYDVRLDDWYRTLDRQKYLLWQWRTVSQLMEFGLTKNEAEKYARWGAQITWTLDSDHVRGTAVDVFFGDWLPTLYPIEFADWRAVADIAKECGILWWYDLRKTDKPHFVDNGKPLQIDDTRTFYQKIWEDEYRDLPRKTFLHPDQVMERLEWLTPDQKIQELVSIIAILFTKLDNQW